MSRETIAQRRMPSITSRKCHLFLQWVLFFCVRVRTHGLNSMSSACGNFGADGRRVFLIWTQASCSYLRGYEHGNRFASFACGWT